jgi:excinuclease UvrABC ATPase subunit
LAIPYETANGRYRYFPPLAEEIRGLVAAHDLPITAAWQDLDEEARREFLEGSGDLIIQPRKADGGPKGKRKPFVGLIDRVRAKFAGKDAGGAALVALQQSETCPDCAGTRLNHAARSVFFGGKAFSEILALTLTEASGWLKETGGKLSDSHGSRVLGSLALLCDACERLGLGHLAWNRPIDTLSGGEAQRLRIAGSLAARLQGGCYALDEPTRGLHAADAALLCGTLRNLVDEQTTVLLVEHNPVVVAGADRVIEMGPGGGSEGGKVVYDGPPAGSPLLNVTASRPPRSTFTKSGHVALQGIRCRNIRDENVTIPLGGVVCVTGVSGSGKSTLVRDVLTPALQSWIDASRTCGANYRCLTVQGRIDRVVYVSQNALSSNPRSLLLTFLGLADDFRTWFHRHSDAATLGLEPGHFSANSEQGQCPACEGLGRVVQNAGGGATFCPACGGTRFHPHVLFAKYRGQSVGEWFSSDLSLLAECDDAPNQVRSAAQLGNELGIGHLSLGRSLPSLSGGECQRLRIVKALLESHSVGRRESRHQVFVMDEPAAGLHPADVDRLNQALHRVVLGGTNTLILVEHNLSIIRLADWVVDVGPLSADHGGRILFAGKVDDFVRSGPEESRTRQALRSELPKQSRRTRPLVEEVLSVGHRTAAESIQAFRDYLALSHGERDADENPSPARPAYLVSAGSDDAHEEHDAFGLLALSLPIYQLYAAESKVTGQRVFPDDRSAREAALVALRSKKGRFVGWFPLTSLAAEESVTWPEIRRAIKDGITRGAYGWFNGAAVQRKPPAADHKQPATHLVRLVVSPDLDMEEAVNRAFALGEGWLSIIDPPPGELDDFSIRALRMPELRVGSRWQMPQIFDSGIQHSACRLCKGGGSVEGVDEKLVIADRCSNIRQDKLLTKQALEAVRAARRRRMMPAVDRLADAGLVDLSVALDKMPADAVDAFWFGYPEKSFLSAGGDEKHKGDWYQWLGLVNYVTANMWKAPDRNWANELSESRHLRPCPRCGGTGLGWEARLRDVQGVTLQRILSEWTVGRLADWLSKVDCRSDVGKTAAATAQSRAELALRFGLADLHCGDRYSVLSVPTRLRVFAVAVAHNQLLGATAYLRPPVELLSQEIERFLEALRGRGNMNWQVEAPENVGSRANSG